MALAIDETNRRRAKQVAHNEANGVDPQPLRKKIGDILDDIYREAEDTESAMAGGGGGAIGGGRQMSRGKAPVPETRSKRRAVVAATEGMARAEIASLISELTEQMLGAARELQFELAARIRDEISEMKKELRQMDVATGAR
jgi:excinuclease ABC subunit B